ncbi:hypothetical protein F8C82_07455 [Phaeocystidibacter marisrubri]|uniref:Uncharacterized protein n=1 Tax=Phaeocystidibacter marisrubri TaxID=1577780 RepID=A0A6L3ZCF2_9FLAO|nr:hypothetical protein F8C82_07455 [Phaeocystidibacter marisrubri]
MQIQDFTFQYEEVNTLLKENHISGTGWRLDGVLPSSFETVSIPNVRDEVVVVQYLGHAYGDELSLRLFVRNIDSSFTIPLAMIGGDSDSYSTETKFDFSENKLYRIQVVKSLIVDDFNMTFYQFDTVRSTYSYDNLFNLRLLGEEKSTYSSDPLTTSPLKFNLPCSSRDSLFAVSIWRNLAFECSGQRPLNSISNEQLSNELMPVSDGCARSLLNSSLTCSIEPVKFWVSGGRLLYETGISELILYTGTDTIFLTYFEPDLYNELSMLEMPVLTDPSISLFRQSEYNEGFHFILNDGNSHRMLTIRNDSLLLLPFPKSHTSNDAMLDELISIVQGTEHQSSLMPIEFREDGFNGRKDSLQLTRIIHRAVLEEMSFADSSLSTSALLSIGRSESIEPITRLHQIENGHVVEVCFNYSELRGYTGFTCYNSIIQSVSSRSTPITTSSSTIDTLFQLSNKDIALIQGYSGSFYDSRSYFNVTFLNRIDTGQYDLQWDSTDFPTGFDAELENGSVIQFTVPFQFENRKLSLSADRSTITIVVIPSTDQDSFEASPITLELKIEDNIIRLENPTEYNKNR